MRYSLALALLLLLSTASQARAQKVEIGMSRARVMALFPELKRAKPTSADSQSYKLDTLRYFGLCAKGYVQFRRDSLHTFLWSLPEEAITASECAERRRIFDAIVPKLEQQFSTIKPAVAHSTDPDFIFEQWNLPLGHAKAEYDHGKIFIEQVMMPLRFRTMQK